ncbi:uncharacterized protein L201_005595 [Kwoniella dendrophila CBS 6074]|uniref:Uncharacterized protein n=1 Tax=Kwoniella dendrophila CBS 6074 TaxID=1295534 RepID=A0AAX4JZP9_9TREE
MSDPNFPPNLDIQPLILTNAKDEEREQYRQKDAIATYGIAGRVWEATRPLLEYFTPSEQFEPPCSLLGTDETCRIIELGSGQSVASLHLAEYLKKNDLIITTDLPEVVPLCEKSIYSWNPPSSEHAQVVAQPLAWGGDQAHLAQYQPFTHILMCDLSSPLQSAENETFGPEVILSYTSRTLSLEESFFDSLALYFKTTPVRGGDWEAKVFICRRWKITEEWTLPDVKDVMNGGKGVIRGRSYGLVDDLFGSLEWDI